MMTDRQRRVERDLMLWMALVAVVAWCIVAVIYGVSQ